MNFLDLLGIEFMKVKRSKIVPLIFIAPLLVVASGVAALSRYFTPEYTNAWPAMFIQSALVYAYYLLPFSMIVVCVMIAGRETQNNGILKMLALPVSRKALSLAKFFVLMFYLFMEMVVFSASELYKHPKTKEYQDFAGGKQPNSTAESGLKPKLNSGTYRNRSVPVLGNTPVLLFIICRTLDLKTQLLCNLFRCKPGFFRCCHYCL